MKDYFVSEKFRIRNSNVLAVDVYSREIIMDCSTKIILDADSFGKFIAEYDQYIREYQNFQKLYRAEKLIEIKKNTDEYNKSVEIIKGSQEAVEALIEFSEQFKRVNLTQKEGGKWTFTNLY